MLVFPDDGNAVLPFFWCPKEGAVAREKRHRVPYLGWARDGFLELTDGNATDFDHVEKKAVELAKRYRIRSLGLRPLRRGAGREPPEGRRASTSCSSARGSSR